MLVDLLAEIETLMFLLGMRQFIMTVFKPYLSHVFINHLDVLMSPLLLGVLGQSYSAGIFIFDMFDKFLGVTDQGTLNGVDKRARSL